MIEMCQEIIPGVSLFDCPIHENTIVQTLLQTQKWMKQYNIPMDRVIRHYDVSGKLCPAPWRHDNWALWSTFKKRLSNLNAGQAITSGTANNTNNTDTDWGAYRKPAEPFKPLKVGDKVTIRKGHQYWHINTTNKKRKASKDFAGDKDVIIKVMDVNVSYSKKAYLLKNKVSWILEQDLVEARTVVTEDFDTYKVVKGDSLWAISQKFNVTVEQIKQWNQLDSNLINIGQELFVQKPTHTGAETPKPNDGKKPDTTVDIDGIEESQKQPVDDGEKTPAVKLKENQILTADGKILEFTDVTNTVKK